MAWQWKKELLLKPCKEFRMRNIYHRCYNHFFVAERGRQIGRMMILSTVKRPNGEKLLQLDDSMVVNVFFRKKFSKRKKKIHSKADCHCRKYKRLKVCSHFDEAVWHWAGNDIVNDCRVTTWDAQPQSIYMYNRRYYHSSSNRSYVKIKLCCDPVTSCANKKSHYNHCHWAPSMQSFSPSTWVSFPGLDSRLYKTRTAVTWIKRSEYRPSLNTPRGKHSIDILISSWV